MGLDLAGKQVRLADGQTVEFDRLLIATGARARPWPDEAEAALDGVYVLRTREDAARLQRAAGRRARRVLVIGGGFTGSEVASVCRELGLPVTVAERGAAPLAGALGGVIGAVAAGMQRDARRRPALRCHGHGAGGRRERAAAARPAVRRQRRGRRHGGGRARRDPQHRVAARLGAGGRRRGGWPATRAAAPSTSTAWSPTTSSSPATWRGSRTRSTSTSSSRWSTGATPSRRPRSPPTT